MALFDGRQRRLQKHNESLNSGFGRQTQCHGLIPPGFGHNGLKPHGGDVEDVLLVMWFDGHREWF
jgi:hypothetical protein